MRCFETVLQQPDMAPHGVCARGLVLHVAMAALLWSARGSDGKGCLKGTKLKASQKSTLQQGCGNLEDQRRRCEACPTGTFTAVTTCAMNCAAKLSCRKGTRVVQDGGATHNRVSRQSHLHRYPSRAHLNSPEHALLGFRFVVAPWHAQYLSSLCTGGAMTNEHLRTCAHADEHGSETNLKTLAHTHRPHGPCRTLGIAACGG